jgi:hypothetical protein
MDPITLALLGGASTLGGMFFNGQAQDQVDAARNAAIQTDRAQQATLDAQAKTITDKSLGRFSSFGDQQAADTTKLSGFYNTPAPAPTNPNLIAALPASTNDVVNREIANKSGLATAFGHQQGDALGKLHSFGDLMGNISRGQAADTQAVGQIGSFKAGDTAVTNIALDNANRAGNTDAAIGNILNGAGKVALTAGLSGRLATPGLGQIGSSTSAANVPFYAGNI